jgi:predicted peptidase
MRCRGIALLGNVLLFVFLSQTSFGQIPTGQSFQQNEDQDSSRTYLQYLLYLPRQYYADKTREWPLIVFLQRLGAEGTNIDLVRAVALPKRLEKDDEFPFIVVSPQALLKQLWKPDLIRNFVETVCDKYQVDRNRIYLTGPSSGGSATWATAVEYPDLFAAIVPVCGRSDPTKYDENAEKITHLPIWVFHGALDRVFPKEVSIEMVNALEKAGANVRFTLYPDVDHEQCWDKPYYEPELYEWLLRQSK